MSYPPMPGQNPMPNIGRVPDFRDVSSPVDRAPAPTAGITPMSPNVAPSAPGSSPWVQPVSQPPGAPPSPGMPRGK